MLGRGIVISLIWLAGFGSLDAFRNCLNARHHSSASAGELQGMGKARWCLIVGGIGIFLWFPVIIIGIMNKLRG
jgi:hypothetical protein